MKKLWPQVLTPLVYELPLLLVQKFGSVHGHYHFGSRPQPTLVFGKRPDNITQSSCLGHGKALRCYM